VQKTVTTPVRLAGLAALLAGIIFVAIQPGHPPDVPESVHTTAWSIIQPVKFVMSILFLLGVTGLYARQVHESGWLGFAGYLSLFTSWALQSVFVFIGAFLLPVLVELAPGFVASYLGIVSGVEATVELGALPGLYGAAGGLYLLGGLLFGIASFRAGVLPKVPSALLALGSVLPLATASFVAHPYDRFLALPVGLALAWLGYALFREKVT